ncbi:MFS transporter [bacterium]|nr:MFS transporter [bacterium]
MKQTLTAMRQIRSRTSRAKRAFFWNTIFTSVYSQTGSATGFIFIAFLLTVARIDDTDVGIVIMLYSLPAVFIPFLDSFSRRFLTGKRIIVIGGLIEVVFITATVLVPVVITGPMLRIVTIGILLNLGVLIQNAVQTATTSWLTASFSETLRVRYIQRLWLWMNATAVLFSVLFGFFLEYPGHESVRAYGLVFAIGLVCGCTGYLFLKNVELPGRVDDLPATPFRTYTIPWRYRDFGRLVFMRASTFLSLGMALPFYIVYMKSVNYLDMRLSLVALYANIQIVLFVAGFSFWKFAAEKYGSKPVLHTVFAVSLFIPVMWIFVNRDNTFLIPFIMGMSGFFQSGMTVASRNLLFNTIPQNSPPPVFLSAWNSYVGCATVAAPLAAVMIMKGFGSVHLSYGSVVLSGIHMVFFSSAVLMAVPLLISFTIPSLHDKPLGYVLRQLTRGNPLMYAYHTLYLLNARTEESRAKAIDELGRSRSPMAIDALVEALDDASPEVRRNAVFALAKTQSEEAVAPLIRELENRESDIRYEACEALGKIGHKTAVETLVKTLDDTDNRIRSAAVTALAEIGGEEAKQRLFELFTAPYNSDIFPTLADGLSRLGVREIVEAVMDRMEDFRSSTLRLQLLNAVCRVLGAGNNFYRIMAKEEYARTDAVNDLIRHMRKNISHIKLFKHDQPDRIKKILDRLAHSYRDEKHREFLSAIWEFMAYIQLVLPEISAEYSTASGKNSQDFSLYFIAVNRFLILKKVEDIHEEGMVFLVMCLDSLLDALQTYHPIST